MSDDFKREDSDKHNRVDTNWKNPEGKHSKIRLERNGAPAKPKIGYRTEKQSRGKHPSGYEEVMVHNPDDLDEVGEGEAARIGSTVGDRKREQIIEKADEEDIKVLNRGEE
ncbi:MAG: 50S ribosomal protein L32e [Candidatus Nanohaloarchaea archaeon]